MLNAKLQIFIDISKQYYLKLIFAISALITSSIVLFILFEQHAKSQPSTMTLVQMVSDNQFELFSQSLQRYNQQVAHVVNQHKMFADINFPIASAHQKQSQLAYDLKHPHQTIYQALPNEIRQSLLQAFMATINYERPQMLKLLLAMELPIDEGTLLTAIKLGQADIVQQLLQYRVITVNEYKDVIIAAINSNNLQIIDLLQHNGISFAQIDLNTMDFKARFFDALAHSNPAILSFFMAHAYQPWLHLESKQVSHFLADLGRHKITNHGQQMLQVLLSNGLPINHYNQFPHTPLITAINLNSVNLVKQLISAGADVNSHCVNSSKRCKPPLWYAINQANKEITQLLLNHGAHAKLINNYSQMLLQQLLPTASPQK